MANIVLEADAVTKNVEDSEIIDDEEGLD